MAENRRGWLIFAATIVFFVVFFLMLVSAWRLSQDRVHWSVVAALQIAVVVLTLVGTFVAEQVRSPDAQSKSSEPESARSAMRGVLRISDAARNVHTTITVRRSILNEMVTDDGLVEWKDVEAAFDVVDQAVLPVYAHTAHSMADWGEVAPEAYKDLETQLSEAEEEKLDDS